MLVIKDLETGYGRKQVLFSVSMDVEEGEIVALIGPNGAGKSTVLKTVFGINQTWNGEIHFRSLSINGDSPARNVASGITLVLQGNRVFNNLTVCENLEVSGYQLSRKEIKKRIENVLEFFPTLKDRTKQNASRLSGGEQQMLALARALIPEPKLLLLDEPTLGLSPRLTANVFQKIVELNREKGVSFLIVEQKICQVLQITKRVYGMKLGRVVFDGESSKVAVDQMLLKEIFL